MANFALIRDLCEKQNITIRKLSELLNKDESSIQLLMRKGSTTTKTLEEIAEILKVHPGYFFDSEYSFQTNNIIGSLNGSKNQIGNNNIINEQSNEIEHLKNLLEEKERILQEKERTINILLTQKQ